MMKFNQFAFVKRKLQKIKRELVNTSGIWFYPVKKLPVGTHLQYFIKNRTRINVRVIFDVGANEGLTALQFYNYFPNAEIYCFEPFEETYKKLVKNISKNTHLKPFQIALGDESKTITVSVKQGEESVANSLNPDLDSKNLNSSSKYETVKVETIDRFLINEPLLRTIDLLKIDTEGYDLKVIKGALDSINEKKVKLIYCEVGFSKNNKWHVGFSEMTAFLEEQNFAFIGIYSLDIRHIGWDGQFGNALYIHKSFLNDLIL